MAPRRIHVWGTAGAFLHHLLSFCHWEDSRSTDTNVLFLSLSYYIIGEHWKPSDWHKKKQKSILSFFRKDKPCNIKLLKHRRRKTVMREVGFSTKNPNQLVTSVKISFSCLLFLPPSGWVAQLERTGTHCNCHVFSILSYALTCSLLVTCVVLYCTSCFILTILNTNSPLVSSLVSYCPCLFSTEPVSWN